MVDTNFENCNVASPDALGFLKQADYIIYGAVIELYTAEEYPVVAYRENVINFIRFLFNLNHWKNKLKKLIFLSSTSIYGNLLDMKTGFTESHPYNPSGVYAHTKMLQEEILLQLAPKLGIPITIIRLTNVFSGSHCAVDPHINPIFKLIHNSYNRIPFPIWFDGQQTRDYLHIEDIFNALKLCIQDKNEDSVYNLGTDTQVSMNEIVEYARPLLEPQIVYEDNGLGFVQHRRINSEKFQSAFGWKPNIQILNGGLELAIEEYRQRYKI